MLLRYIVIFVRTQEELLERLDRVLTGLREVGLKVKPSKCVLFQKRIEFLGHLVSEHGVESLPGKIEATENC